MLSSESAVMRWVLVGVIASSVLGAPTAPAADTPESSLAEVVVTAERREERLQDVPVSVTALSTKELQSKGIQNTLDLAQVVPALTLTSDAGATQVRLRGVGTTNFGPGVENPVAMYIDGVYIASTSGAFFDLANIQRVEVLKGPQGTLFGRNATGGLIQVITPDPSNTFTGLVRAGYGNYQTATVDAYVSGPIANMLAADLTVHYAAEGQGWGRNLHTGDYVNRLNDDLIVRSKVKFEPSDDIKFILAGDFSSLLGSRPVTLQEVAGYRGDFEAIYGPQPHGGFYDNNGAIDPRAKITADGVSLTASFQLGANELKSITAYRTTKFEDQFPLTRVPQDVLLFSGTPKWEQFSQELQFLGRVGKLNYTTGIYFFSSADQYNPFHLDFGTAFAPIAFAAAGPGIVDAYETFNNKQSTDSIAGYAQASYEVYSDTDLTLGVRYTDETKKVSGTQSLIVNYVAPIGNVPFVPPGTPYLAPGIDPKLTNGNVSYRVALDHKFTPDVMGYVSFNTGFKSGGYNLTTPANPAFAPEKLNATEAGLKMEFLERRVRLNIDAYHYDYTNIQVNNFIQSSTYIVNGGKAKMDGFEIESEWRVTEGLNLNAGLAYVNDRFTDFPNAGYNYMVPGCVVTGNPDTPCLHNAAGNRLPATPSLTGNVGFSYEKPIQTSLIGITGNVYHSSGWYGDFDNDPRAYQKAYNLVNTSVYFESKSGGPRVTAWAKNLFNQEYVSNVYVSSQQPTFQAGAPRTYGVTVEARF